MGNIVFLLWAKVNASVQHYKPSINVMYYDEKSLTITASCHMRRLSNKTWSKRETWRKLATHLPQLEQKTPQRDLKRKRYRGGETLRRRRRRHGFPAWNEEVLTCNMHHLQPTLRRIIRCCCYIFSSNTRSTADRPHADVYVVVSCLSKNKQTSSNNDIKFIRNPCVKHRLPIGQLVLKKHNATVTVQPTITWRRASKTRTKQM